MTPFLRGLPLFLLGFISLAGCGSRAGGDRQEIRGEITLGGQPLDQGVIQFTPKGGGGSFAGAEIKNGRYRIPSESGLSPGTYEVRISAGAPGTAVEEAMPGESGPLAEERIPPQFNAQTTLVHTVTARAIH